MDLLDLKSTICVWKIILKLQKKYKKETLEEKTEDRVIWTIQNEEQKLKDWKEKKEQCQWPMIQ